MLFAFIGVFILGAIAGIFGLTALSMHYANMTFDEMTDVGWMMIEAGNNRESSMVLYRNDGTSDEITFKDE